jgi:predicted ATP-grasp superfamily ATP-dependent carboligase
MRVHPTLEDMVLFKQGRLSVVPVTQAQFDAIVALADVPADAPAKTTVTPKTKPVKSVGRSAKPKKRAKSIVAKKAPERVAPKKGAGPKARKRAKSSR